MMDEDADSMFLPDEKEDTEHEKSKADALGAMSDNEMQKHMLLCLKLAAENKINAKNAFGLHLIKIFTKRVGNDVPDLQFASLSLQASSKIYAGRVEALYRDTFAFHNQLQTVALNEKGDKGPAINNQSDDDEEVHKEKRKTSRPRQTYLANEDNVSLKSEASYINTFPHHNFITMKSAFNASRTSSSLVGGLVLENDSCQMCCTISSCYFYPRLLVPVNDFLYPVDRKNLIRKAQNIKEIHFDPDSTESDVFFPPAPRTPPANPDFDLPSDDSFCIGTTPIQEKKDEDVQEIIEKFSTLDITADLLVNDLSLALVNGNTIDSRLLPPNSALKKVFSTAEKTKRNKTPAKPRKERPPKEPFFSRRTVDRALLKKGGKIDLKDNDISEWQLSATTHLHCGGHDKFSKELADNYDNTDSNEKEIILTTTFKLIQKPALQTNLENYFLKSIQLWNHFEHHSTACLVRPSSFGVCRLDDIPQEMTGTFENSKSIVQSFQNLSLHNSPVGSDDFCLDADNDDFNRFSLGMPNDMSRLNFEDDYKSVMVTPPELVKPLNLNFQIEPVKLSTEKVKNALWNVIEKNEAIMLTELHKKIKMVFVGEKLPVQYVFTMLLLLANEKCLLIETVLNGADMKISKDILEKY